MEFRNPIGRIKPVKMTAVTASYIRGALEKRIPSKSPFLHNQFLDLMSRSLSVHQIARTRPFDYIKAFNFHAEGNVLQVFYPKFDPALFRSDDLSKSQLNVLKLSLRDTFKELRDEKGKPYERIIVHYNDRDVMRALDSVLRDKWTVHMDVEQVMMRSENSHSLKFLASKGKSNEELFKEEFLGDPGKTVNPFNFHHLIDITVVYKRLPGSKFLTMSDFKR